MDCTEWHNWEIARSLPIGSGKPSEEGHRESFLVMELMERALYLFFRTTLRNVLSRILTFYLYWLIRWEQSIHRTTCGLTYLAHPPKITKNTPFFNISYPTFLWGLGSHECAKYFNTSKIENRSKGARKRKEVRRHLIIHYILPKGHRISQGRTFPITEAIIGHLILNKK